MGQTGAQLEDRTTNLQSLQRGTTHRKQRLGGEQVVLTLVGACYVENGVHKLGTTSLSETSKHSKKTNPTLAASVGTPFCSARLMREAILLACVFW